MRSISISHKGQAKELEVTEATTVGELRIIVAETFGVEPQNQRLLLKGGNFANDSMALEEAIPTTSTRIVLMGTATREVEQFRASTALRQEGVANRRKYMAEPYRTRTVAEGEGHGFGGFETLEGFADRDRALQMLRRLATDEGVRQVMRKHAYSVGILRELHPAERTILGYNRNRGQVIALRLRTDALDGFRDYIGVRTVLMHELAHMVWDDHDAGFKALNSQHCREVVELDWTLRGRTTGPVVPRYEPTAEESSQTVDGGALGAGGFVLGGEAPQLPPGDLASRRDLIYKAIQKRMDKHS
ncbi:hypothetical protein EV175_004981 [Coemansia sp. RSA 1933]|nr:hypothetical protein EV175_004981 [Coemansia sp. RSA 1933]